MNRSEVIALRVGSDRWLRMGQQLVSLLGLVGILCCGARIAWVVIAACAWAAAQGIAGRALREAADVSALMLRSDGSALVLSSTGTEQALPCAGSWVSRWFSVLMLERLTDGRHMRLLVCRSVNDADAYRQLLMQLRLSNSDPARGAARQA